MKLYLKSLLDRYVYTVPIFLFIASFISNFIELNYVIAGNLFGCSIFVNLGLFYLYNFKEKYCWLTRNAPIGLILINIVDIIGDFIDYNIYNFIFNIAILSTISILAIIFYIKQKIER